MKMKRSLVSGCILTAIISIGLCIAPATAQLLGFEVEQLTDNKIDDVLMDISEGWVVYNSSEDPAAGEVINLYEIATRTTIQLTSSDELSAGADIDDGIVVWQTFDRSDAQWDGEIWAEDLFTGQRTRITDNPFNEYCPIVDNGYVLWVRGINSNWFELYMHDLASGVTTQLAAAQYVSCATIEDGRATWAEGYHSSSQIYLYEVETGEKRRISSGTYKNYYPWISERLVAWHQFNGTGRSLLVYDLNDSSTTSLYTQPGNSFAGTGVKVSDARVVWFASSENDHNTAEIYIYDADTGLTNQLTDNQNYDGWPDIDGEHVVWQAALKDGRFEIWHHDLSTATTSQIARAKDSLEFPMVEEGNIAWRARPGWMTREVFLAKPEFD